MIDFFHNKCKSHYSDETIDMLRLIRSENVGPKTFFSLIKFFGSASRALENIADFSLRGGKSKPIRVYSKLAASKELDLLEKNGARILSYKDPSYCSLLKETPDFPPIVTYKGNISLLNSKKNISIVGARNSSANSKSFASNLSQELTNDGYVTVSGLARGIDTAVHKAQTKKTIAVIAGGIDHIYPIENNDLFNQIASEGLIISELPIGATPLAKHFPQRNRIIAGLSQATIVIEAGLKSGSLITANCALDYNREVFSVPGFPLDPRCMGSNKLIKEGAYLLESYEDLVSNLNDFKQMKVKLKEDPTFSPDNFDFPRGAGNLEIKNSDREKVLSLLSSTPVSFEQISNESGLPLVIIYMICLELELAGRIVRHVGNKISLIY